MRRSTVLSLLNEKKNIVFLGESGCGKSEIALNFACALSDDEKVPVHFFDMDQTKPLFRSRDAKEVLKNAGVVLHYEEQHMDAPTLVGGVNPHLLNSDVYTILDVGGNHTGARMIGGFSQCLTASTSEIFYVVNPFRPWSREILEIDATLSSILKASRLNKFSILANPNLGKDTNAQEFLNGMDKLNQMLGDVAPIKAATVREDIYEEVKGKTALPLIPISLSLLYPWEEG